MSALVIRQLHDENKRLKDIVDKLKVENNKLKSLYVIQQCDPKIKEQITCAWQHDTRIK